MRLLQAELVKIATAPRTAIALLLVLAAFVALGSASTASSGDDSPFASESVVSDVLEVAATAAFFALILGVLIVTWEYRHGTITPTFLITPRRERVIGAKAAVAAAIGVGIMLVAIALALVLALIWIDLEIRGGHWEYMGRMVFGGAAWAVLGVGLGAAIQSQVGGLILIFVWFLLGEPLIGAAFDALDWQVSDYFPGSALGRLFATGPTTGEFGGEQHAYGLWAAAAVVAAYSLGAALVGTLLVRHRDVA